METVKKIISIGANCIAADFTKALGIREKGPVDNISDFNIWKSPTLFTRQFYKDVFHSNYAIRNSSKEQIEKFHFFNKFFCFSNGMCIVHNDFRKIKFRFSLKRRIVNFRRYYKKSIKQEGLWYVYSLDYLDKQLSENRIRQVRNQLPKVCSEHLIVLAIRAHNPFFKKYFKYYLEIDNEDIYKWNSMEQALEIKDSLFNEYGLILQTGI